MMLRIGNRVSRLAGLPVCRLGLNRHTGTPAHRLTKRGFTLVEVLIAIVILSVGMIGVIRGYVVMMNGIEASRFTVEASYLLKEKIADVEKEAIENAGIPSGTRSGRLEQDYAIFRWEVEAGQVKIDAGKSKEKPREESKEGPKEILNNVRISVIGANGFNDARGLSLYTYIGSYPELGR